VFHGQSPRVWTVSLYWGGVRAVLEKSTWLSGLKVALPVVTHGLLTRDISAKKLIKQGVTYQSPGCSTAGRFSGGVTGAMPG